MNDNISPSAPNQRFTHFLGAELTLGVGCKSRKTAAQSNGSALLVHHPHQEGAFDPYVVKE